MPVYLAVVAGFLLVSAGEVRGDQPGASPLSVPRTRPEMKQYLEDLKSRKPRIPLPELTDEERTELGARQADYEARLRFHYLPPGEARGGFGFSREPDPNI